MAREHSGPGKVDVDGHPELLEHRHPLAMVYGGGGVFGIAYTAGVAEGLIDAGLPVATAPSLGTSAGSWTASALALGMRYADYSGAPTPRVPNLRTGVLADIARGIFGSATHHLVAVSAVCVTTGRRHVLDGGAYPLADLVAASSAVPGLLPPHRVAGRWYVDGGMWSATSIDASAEADRVIVVAPLAGSVVGPVGRTAGFLLGQELRRCRTRHASCDLHMIRPNREIARLAGRTPLSLFDPRRARAVYPLAYRQGLMWGERILAGDRPAA